MKPYEKYIKLRNNNGKILINKNSLKKLAKIDAIIFDCDGVLIDVRKSYYNAILKTVNYIIKNLTNLNVKDFVSSEIIYSFKKSGGYNNEWDVSYAITLFILTKLPKNILEEISSIVNSNFFKEIPLCKRLKIIKNGIRKNRSIKIPKSIKNEIREFANRMDYSGIASIDKVLRKSFKINEKFLKSIKKILSYPGEIEKSILKRVFEEFFYGYKIFKKFYNIKPCFYFGKKGLINNDKLIISNKLLNNILRNNIKIGIVSGRPFISAKYSLKKIIEKINEEALFFSDKIAKASKKSRIEKPNPFMLLECAKRLEPFNIALYIGDSIEDVIMVKLANKKERKFLFAGVYNYTLIPNKTILEFINLNADLILPSILDLPLIINKFKGVNLNA